MPASPQLAANTPSTLENALREAERATALLSSALRTGDPHFLEHLEARRIALAALEHCAPSAFNETTIRRLHAVRRGGEVALALVRVHMEQTRLELKAVENSAGSCGAPPASGALHYLNIDVKA